MAAITVTYSFSNGTAADATAVNTNFNDIISGTSDGTKDFNIAALTCAGTATFNGNVLLGNASGDDVQFNGSLATSIPIKTQRTYDIGSADLGTRLIYLGMNSTYTIAFGAPSSGASADYTILLPATVPSIGQFLRDTDGAGTTGWASIYTVNASAGTSGVTLTKSSSDAQYFNPTSAGITVKLDNSFKAGRVMTIYNDGTKDITLTANDDTTIRTIYRKTCGVVMCKSDTPTTNTSWLGFNQIVSPAMDWSNDFGFSSGLTSQSNVEFWGKRVGDRFVCQGAVEFTGTAATTLLINLPATMQIDTAKHSSQTNRHRLGLFFSLRETATSVISNTGNGALFFDGSDTDAIYFADSAGGTAKRYTKDTGSSMIGGGRCINFNFEYSVSGWTDF